MYIQGDNQKVAENIRLFSKNKQKTKNQICLKIKKSDKFINIYSRKKNERKREREIQIYFVFRVLNSFHLDLNCSLLIVNKTYD